MDSALLQNLMAGAGSSSQFIGGLVVALLYIVIGFAQRDWKHSYLSTNLPRTMGTDILDLFPCRDCRLLPKLRGLFRGLNSCLAN
jgi:hypothetical protein